MEFEGSPRRFHGTQGHISPCSHCAANVFAPWWLESITPVGTNPHPPTFFSLLIQGMRNLKLPDVSLNFWASQVLLVVKNLPANSGDIRDTGSIPRLERSPGGRHSNPLQYSCLENSMDRGAWWAAVHGVTKSRTQQKWLSTHSLNFQINGTSVISW